jgi:hypothetical protein
LSQALSSQLLNTDTGFPTDTFLFSSSHLPLKRLAEATAVDDAAGISSYINEGRTELSQVPRGIAELLVRNYVEKVLPLYPFLEGDDLWAHFHKTYPLDGSPPADPTPYDIFVTSAMLCVSIMTSRSSDSSRVALCSQQIFRNALCHAQDLFTSNIQTLQGMLLLAQYSYLMPESASTWETVGLSMRMVLELGLHRDPEETMAETGIGIEEAHLRRRIFWCVYEMDRSICGTSHRRLSVAEGAITTKYPSGLEDSCYLCVVRFRRIQSEITTVNYLCSDAPPLLLAAGHPGYEAWAEQMERKIFDWRERITSKEYKGPEWHDIAVYHGIVALYRPSPRNPSPRPESLMKCFVAATEVVSGYWEHANSGFLKYSWHAVHQGFESAVAMLYALRKCKSALKERFGTRKILETVHLYSSLFVLLGERWQKATPCYETYERLKMTVLKELMRPGDQSFDHVVGDELDQLILPANALARIGLDVRASTSSLLDVDKSSSSLSLARPDNMSPTFISESILASTTRWSENHPSAVIDPNLASGHEEDLLKPLDWTNFEWDAFDEEDLMRWAM